MSRFSYYDDQRSPSPSPSPSPSTSPGRSPSRRPGRSRSRSRVNIGNVIRITEMTPYDIDGINSLYKVDVYGGHGRTKYTLSDDQVVDIEKVELIHRDEDIVHTLQRILNRALGPQPIAGRSHDVCIYYVKNAISADDARDMMNAYSEKFPNYKEKKTGYEVRKYINLLSLLKRSNLKTTSGGRRHQRRSRRGKGNGRGKKSRSSKTLRRSRR